MQPFIPITPEDLDKLTFTVGLLDKLGVDPVDVEIRLFGMSKDRLHRKGVEVCIEADRDEEDTRVQPKIAPQDIAVAIQLTPKRLDELVKGSAKLTDETEFAYLDLQGQVKTGTFWGLTFPKKYQMPGIQFAELSNLAVSTYGAGLREYALQFASKPVVTRATPPAGASAPAGEVIPPERKKPTKPAPTNQIDQFLAGD